MRLFVASALSDSVRTAVAARLAPIVAANPSLRAVPVGSEHLTHAFLGETDSAPAAILQALEPVAASEAIPIRLGRPRVLASRGRPRLVLLELIEGAAAVARLGAAVREHLSELFPELASQRAKDPHVTVARFRRGAGRRELSAVERLLEESGPAACPFEDVLRRVDLMQSELAPRGPRYTRLGGIGLS